MFSDKKYKENELGQGALDLKLFLNMIKSMKFDGMFLIDARKDIDLAKANLKLMAELLSENNFELKNTKEIMELITHRKTKKPFTDVDHLTIQSTLIL